MDNNILSVLCPFSPCHPGHFYSILFLVKLYTTVERLDYLLVKMMYSYGLINHFKILQFLVANFCFQKERESEVANATF